jgi:Fe-S oxidoreductase
MTRVLYLPGCSFDKDEQETAINIFSYLKSIYDDVTYFKLCCGAISEPYNFEKNLKFINDTLIREAVNYDHVIVNCANCYDYYLRNIKDDVCRSKIITIYDVVVKNYIFNKDYQGRVVSIHDPCPVRNYDNLHEDIRFILTRLNFSIEEVKYSKRLTKCCGMGGLLGFSNYMMKRKFTKERDEEFRYPVITYCSDCTRTLKNSSHILKYLF